MKAQDITQQSVESTPYQSPCPYSRKHAACTRILVAAKADCTRSSKVRYRHAPGADGEAEIEQREVDDASQDIRPRPCDELLPLLVPNRRELDLPLVEWRVRVILHILRARQVPRFRSSSSLSIRIVSP